MRWLFQALLLLLANSADSDLAKQVLYLQAENEILRNHLGNDPFWTKWIGVFWSSWAWRWARGSEVDSTRPPAAQPAEETAPGAPDVW
jgi:hypothetical protein